MLNSMERVEPKRIKILISQLQGFKNPKLQLEQYETDGESVGFFLQRAWKDLVSAAVVDLGCGTGNLTFASVLAGARLAVGVDIDREALKIAIENKEFLINSGFDVVSANFVCADVENVFFKRKFDVCIMNPPFGIQKRKADRIFLTKAFEVADVVWTFLSYGSKPFVQKFAEENSFSITDFFTTKIQIHQKFSFHRKKVEFLQVDLYRIQRIW